MLSVSNLHAGYGRTAVLSGVDLHVGLGEIVAILGRNGVGKTTLLRTIMGLLPARGASLSGGQQQLLALARALTTQPRLLLLDEATQGIQPSIVAVIGQKVQDINRNRGVAVLLVEQNIEFAVALASRTYIMNKGQIVLELAPQDVLRDQT